MRIIALNKLNGETLAVGEDILSITRTDIGTYKFVREVGLPEFTVPQYEVATLTVEVNKIQPKQYRSMYDIEAMQYTGENSEIIREFFGDTILYSLLDGAYVYRDLATGYVGTFGEEYFKKHYVEVRDA